jgi:nucleolar pre-ribosomal-associated protein 2
MVSQYGVETVFDALGVISAPGSHQYLQGHAPKVYLRLCQITNAILSFHRKNISGRMHLLVPFIQTLMNPLFIMHANSKPAVFQKSPSWLSNRIHDLDATHATAFSRIILTLTQPTVSSSLTHYRSYNNPLLIDETRRARQYAAQFVPYILAHFCGLHLIGRLSPEIRKALLPGIWACIEAVPREGLRGMNAGMGREDRAIWSALWAEWSRSRGKA